MTAPTHIDPNDFALHFMAATVNQPSAPHKADLDASAKDGLLAYLSAYYLVEDFNRQEASDFNDQHAKHFADLSFKELTGRIQGLNRY